MRATTTTSTGRFGRAAVLGLAAMAGLGLLPAAPASAAGGPAPTDATISNFSFSPDPLTIPVGTTVQWTNDDGVSHTVTADDGSFDSNPDCSAGNPKACMSDHDTFKHTFGAEGRYPYFSKPWGGPGGQGASGAIVVVTPPPAPPKKGAPTGSTTTTTLPPPKN